MALAGVDGISQPFSKGPASYTSEDVVENIWPTVAPGKRGRIYELLLQKAERAPREAGGSRNALSPEWKDWDLTQAEAVEWI